MPALRPLLRHLLSTETVCYECRSCGTALDSDTQPCPECGSEEIGSYRLTS